MRRKPTACPCEEATDGESISSLLRCSAPVPCSALLLTPRMCQAGVCPSSARSRPDLGKGGQAEGRWGTAQPAAH